ncbi:unnamed protein product [Linum trigynum]|uniref:Uncharacterized protein n=1 Tax=Linum trigynum TaxID=586398 RepID=A0AAV2DBF6_9ROSI
MMAGVVAIDAPDLCEEIIKKACPSKRPSFFEPSPRKPPLLRGLLLSRSTKVRKHELGFALPSNSSDPNPSAACKLPTSNGVEPPSVIPSSLSSLLSPLSHFQMQAVGIAAPTVLPLYICYVGIIVRSGFDVG